MLIVTNDHVVEGISSINVTFIDGTTVDAEVKATEEAEDYLFSLGLTNFRVRRFADAARIQVPADQIGIIMNNREMILDRFKKDYKAVLLDLEVRK